MDKPSNKGQRSPLQGEGPLGDSRAPFDNAAAPFDSPGTPCSESPVQIPTVEITAETLKADSVHFPETVFLLGSRMDYVHEHIREIDRSMHLGLGNIIDSTPPYWVHIDPFSIADRMVTNGDYLQFLHHKSAELSPQGEPRRLYNTADLWDAVWTQLDLKLKTVRMPVKDKDGEVYEVEETFVSALNFVHAYILSLENEVERLLMSIEDESGEFSTADSGEVKAIRRPGKKTQRYLVSRTDVSSRLFALIKWKLRASIVTSPSDERFLLSSSDKEKLRHYTSIESVLSDIDSVIRNLKPRYLQAIDRRLRDLFQKGRHNVETILFLQRFRSAFEEAYRRDKDLWASTGLDQVLYPRGWPSPYGEPKKLIRVQKLAEWKDLPVTGVSLYESVAYCVWLQQLTGLDVSLPNEFQYERAASWPVDHGVNPGVSDLTLDPGKKDIFPWETHNKRDFNYYFGQVDSLESFQASKYTTVLEKTSRHVGKDKLKMLLGFGWQWTIDRYDDSERKYNRFESANYPLFLDVQCFDANDPEKPVRVFEYQPRPSGRGSFVLRGAPQVIGGPGTTTRRFAGFPLRGYRNVGFRYVLHG